MPRPNWTTYYRLGREFSKELEAVMTLDEIGARFGLSRQNTYTLCVVALGKLVYGLQQLTANDRRRRL